jgi:hypothetical protein
VRDRASLINVSSETNRCNNAIRKKYIHNIVASVGFTRYIDVVGINQICINYAKP